MTQMCVWIWVIIGTDGKHPLPVCFTYNFLRQRNSEPEFQGSVQAIELSQFVSP